MNDQIKELALKSGIAYLSEHTAYFQANDGLTVLPSVSSLEKFAELIVKECLDIVEDEDDGSADTKSVRWAMIRIKKHFGVKE